MKKTRLFSVVTLALILCTVPLTIVSGVMIPAIIMWRSH